MYLASLLKEYHPALQLCSSDKMLLEEPRTKGMHGDRAFSVAGPTLWNELPMSLRESGSLDIFKKKLKTHLFIECYSLK